MDLTIPYTFYPIALPGWIAWILFLTAMAVASVSAWRAAGREGGWQGFARGRQAWCASWPQRWSHR
jgi:hypothetical protein